MTDTVLISCANGRVSGALIDELQRLGGVHVRAMVHSPGKAPTFEARGIETVVADIGDPGSLEPAFDGVDGVWMLAPMSPRAPEFNMNLLWAARAAGARYALRLSAIGAADDAPTRNGRLHSLSDKQLLDSELVGTVIKPHMFMQNLLGSADAIAAGRMRMFLGDGRVGMVDIRDVAAAAAQILLSPGDHDGATYTLTGPDSVSLHEAAAAIGAAIGREVEYEPVETAVAHQGMIEAGMSKWLADSLVEYGEAYAGGWGDFVTADVAELTGTAPRPVADFARDFSPILSGGR